MIPARTVTLLSGDGGTGKSLIATQLAVAVALGSEWLGQTVHGGAAVYISAEDDEDELLRRLHDIAATVNVGLSDLDRLTICSLAGGSALLATLQRDGVLRATRLLKDLEGILAKERPVIIILDTLADLFPGNENDRSQSRQFVGMMRGLAVKYDCTVLILSHPSVEGMKSGSGTSGSTAWSNSVRSRLYLDRIRSEEHEADPDMRIIRCLKNNYARIGAEIRVRWKDGCFIHDTRTVAGERSKHVARADRVFLHLLRSFSEQGRTVNSRSGPNYAPKVFSVHPDSEGITKSAFRMSMEKLLSNGVIRVVNSGTERRPTTYLAEVT